MSGEEQVNILIVDDIPENLLAFEAILDDPGWNLVRAGSGREALRHLLREQFAVILLDVHMPEMDGFETATLIRQRDVSAHTPIIFVTAVGTSDAAAARGYSLGAVDYLFKPVVPEILRSKVTVFADLFRLRRQIERQAAELAIVNEELSTFSYSVSHDLRAPLRALAGFCEILLRDYSERLDRTGRDHLQRIGRASDRMNEMISALLGLSRVTRQNLEPSIVDLSETARSVGRELAAGAQDRNVVLTVQPGIVARGDPALLRIVLENLIGNARKFTGKRPQAQIEFGATREAGPPTFFVRDNGVGFEMADAERMFGAFQRLHEQSEYPGTGIGLATVQRIVHRHGGQVWAKGEVDGGATFFFTLGDQSGPARELET